MKYLSKAIMVLGILFFTYRFLMIDIMISVSLGWIVVPLAFLLAYKIAED